MSKRKATYVVTLMARQEVEVTLQPDDTVISMQRQLYANAKDFPGNFADLAQKSNDVMVCVVQKPV